jgi:uncharacterized SAM-binding protein YcdF (DUF218 family)
LVKELDLPLVLSVWVNRTPQVLALALATALFWNRLWWRRLATGIAVTLALVWTAVAYTPLCELLARGLPRQDEMGPAEAVYVFGSGVQDDGELNSRAMTRTLHGLELIARGLAPRLIISELPEPTDHVEPATRRLMKDLNIEAEVLVVAPVWNTHEEAVAVGALCRERGWRRVLAVTSPYHSRRACASIERQGVEVICTPAVETNFNVQKLLGADERIRAFSHIMHERLGLWVYHRRGWVGRY